MQADLYQCSVTVKVNRFVNLQTRMVYNIGTYIMALCFFCFNLLDDSLMLRTNDGFVSTSMNIGDLTNSTYSCMYEKRKIIFVRSASAIDTIGGANFEALRQSQLFPEAL